MEQKYEFTDKSVDIITAASTLAVEKSNIQIEPIHILAAFTRKPEDGTQPYIRTIFEKGRFDYEIFEGAVNRGLNKIPSQTPPPSEANFSRNAAAVLNKANQIRMEQKDGFIGQDHLLLSLIEDNSIKAILTEAHVKHDQLKKQIILFRADKKIDSKSADTSEELENLKKFATDLTEKAREGKIDPVIGRDEEIRFTIRVLARRMKSNPCLLGEPGVGKTAIVEGVAQRIVDDDVPTAIKGCRLFELDLARLKAGAKYQGDYEERLKGVIKEIEESKSLIILFIDEIHMMMGNGKDDAANILKPALSRGTIKAIGATTSAEYRQIIEKDGAFERRFQKVDVKEPTVDETAAILRGLQLKYEAHHGVRIKDSALISAAMMGKRYFTYRKLPDSAIDLVDMACAGVAIARDSKPEDLDQKERLLQRKLGEIQLLKRDKDPDPITQKSLEESRRLVENLYEELEPLRAKYDTERSKHAERIVQNRKLDELLTKIQQKERDGDYAAAADLKYYAVPETKERIRQLDEEINLEATNATADSMIKYVVDADTIAETAARLTGIPVSKLNQTENAKLLKMEKVLSGAVIGQREAVKAVSDAIKISRSGVGSSKSPASFLFLGSSGSGKTELAKKLADFLFNDEKAMIRIDCSELMEKHSVSKLLGTTAGYIGFEEGGLLTNQLKRRPYSVVLFDEVEKAAPDVLSVLLQLLDDGRITSGQGEVIDATNCIVILTSNLGSQFIYAQKGSKIIDTTKEAVMNVVRSHFRPEFINRISSIIVFNKLSKSNIHRIVSLRLRELEGQWAENNKNFKLDVSADAIDYLARHGYHRDLGARPLNRLIVSTIVNQVAVLVLKQQILDNETIRVVKVGDTNERIEVLPNHEGFFDSNMDVDMEDSYDMEEDYGDSDEDDVEDVVALD